jgi:heat shock protein beta
VWDWELMNDIKPIWQRPSKEVEEDEYKAFYKSFSKVNTIRLLYLQGINEQNNTLKLNMVCDYEMQPSFSQKKKKKKI